MLCNIYKRHYILLSNQFATIGTKSFVPKVRIDSKSSNFANVVDINIILYRVSELRIYTFPKTGNWSNFRKKRSYRLFPKGTCRDIKKKLFDKTWIIFFFVFLFVYKSKKKIIINYNFLYIITRIIITTFQ